jgi:hypothetical protein
LKPIITIYSGGADEEPKKFEGFMEAAFWIGVDHAEGDLASVKVRQPTESYDEEVSTLREFTELLVRRQISFSVEFFSEPRPMEDVGQPHRVAAEKNQGRAPLVLTNGNEFQEQIAQLKEDYRRGTITKKQYKSRKDDILKLWRERVEGRLGI